MIRVILNTFLGILTTIAGFCVSYVYLKSLNGTSQPLLLFLAFPLVIIGIILLIRTSRTDESLVISTYQEPKNDEPVSPPPDKRENLMEKNSQLLDNWIKESEKRDKLKLLEIAAAAEEENEKNSKTSM
jgi:hypothetical protein